MKIGVFGAGGLGGYFGGRLAARGDAEVVFVARGDHAEAMLARGLRVLSPRGDVHVADPAVHEDAAAIGRCDVVLACTKLFDLEVVIAAMAPMVGADTLVVSLQNGVDAVGLLQDAFGAKRVAGATVWIAAEIAEPGVVRHNAELERLIVGTLHPAQAATLARFVEVAAAAGVQIESSHDIELEIWKKFTLLAPFSGLTTAFQVPIGLVLGRPASRRLYAEALFEAAAVGRAVLPRLPVDLAQRHMAATHAMPADMKSSMQTDYARGERLELDWLSGVVVRLGAKRGVATPTHRWVCKAVALARQAGDRGVPAERTPPPAD